MDSPAPQSLILNLSAYEGPLEVLLDLAKAQKVDLAEISILALVNQYLEFVREVKRRNLDLAADYLVMAAVLAYLKSQLLLPPPEIQDIGLDPATVAEALAQRLKRLQAMKDSGLRLMELPHLGQERFPTDRRPVASITTRVRYVASLYDLLSAYAGFKRREDETIFRVEHPKVFKFEQALSRLQDLLKIPTPHWQFLQDFLPQDLAAGGEGAQMRRSALASTLLAGLELTKQGRLELRQDQAFGPLLLRSVAPLSSENKKG